ncbi:E2 ligase fold family C protein [Mesorhizobium sp. B283B1A]|uniref:E2 ligase fold family C protein n=1 Tax=Mesorhizobium TaxID=68287 RepID=UPI001CD17947|nr:MULTISPECIES: E2 ligase fold family C protein [Mesorhizobium]MCA0049444.1 E2 ligase fold family C protein [Mesorhizobium sp. B283B1A]UQS67227.1 E2 ligase fold family C protein [Mesorhizobium opportunistum]
MTLANFIDRAATAASQVLTDFHLGDFKAALEKQVVAIAFDNQAASCAEGQATLDLAVRLLARLYPVLAILPLDSAASSQAQALERLAKSINPRIGIRRSGKFATVGIVAGATRPSLRCPTFFIGSDGWAAKLSHTDPVSSGSSLLPYGAGAASCFAAANVFRTIFAAQLTGAESDENIDLSLYSYNKTKVRDAGPTKFSVDLGEMHFVGLGAIGHGSLWTLAKQPDLSGRLHVVDHETIELSNLQRYVLAGQAEVGMSKAVLATTVLRSTALEVEAHPLKWAEYVARRGDWVFDRVGVALDTAADRLAVQGALPRWIANAWTQEHDLGISRHGFDDGQACLCCMYMPSVKSKDEHQLIAEELGLPDAHEQVKTLLQTNAGVPDDFVARVATAMAVPFEPLAPFVGQPLRSFYQQAICGGLVFQLSGGSRLVRAVVPMAFQSALAGIMLAAELVKHSAGFPMSSTTSTRVNLLRPLGPHLHDPKAKDSSGRCICSDEDFIAAYRSKYGEQLNNVSAA